VKVLIETSLQTFCYSDINFQDLSIKFLN